MPGLYPFPEDCEDCADREPCEKHEHLAESDGEWDHKEAGL